jgi:hypothetical protein
VKSRLQFRIASCQVWCFRNGIDSFEVFWNVTLYFSVKSFWFCEGFFCLQLHGEAIHPRAWRNISEEWFLQFHVWFIVDGVVLQKELLEMSYLLSQSNQSINQSIIYHRTISLTSTLSHILNLRWGFMSDAVRCSNVNKKVKFIIVPTYAQKVAWSKCSIN